MKILIGTKNPGKITGAKIAFEQFFDNVEVMGINAPSGVSDQPINAETYNGAKNRVFNTKKFAEENGIDADFYVGIESGIVNFFDNWYITNFAVICDKNGYYSSGTSASFPVPQKHVNSIQEKTLGHVMDSLFNESELRLSTGGIGLLTHEKITRIDLNTQAFTMALTQFVNGDVWHN